MTIMSVVAPAASPDEIALFLGESVGDAIHLVAITPDGPIAGRWFGDDAAAATAWALERNEAGANLYWTANRCRPGVNKKASKADIETARFAHVDVDPPKDGGAWDKEAARAALLGTIAAQPSFIIDSGGGLQAFWRLDEETPNLAAIETLNVGLRDHFAGDACQSIDHVMRLPGTVNYPDKRKRARGRTATRARVIEADYRVCHAPLTIARYFRAPPAEQRGDGSAGDRPAPAPLVTADSLGLPLRDPVRATIDYPPGRDRSADALACAGAMARAGFTDAQIEGVLLNPDNAVSAHCLGQKNSVRAAWRCIQAVRADTEPTKPLLDDAWPALDLAACALAPTPVRQWVVEGWVPASKATLLAGDGGVGKSLLAQMKATCIAAGLPFLGLETRQANAAYVSWEDDADELWRRQEAICAALGIDMAGLVGKLHLVSFTEEAEPFLVVADDGGVRVTDLGRRIERLTERHAIGLLVLDNASQIAGIDHNAVEQVAPFAHWLGTLAKRTSGAVLLLHHTNKAGQDYLGSVAYNNQFRSRLLLARPEAGIDADERLLTNPKANYSQAGGKVAFRWYAGAFVRDADLAPEMRAELAATAAIGGDNAIFLDCLEARTNSGLIVSPNVSPNYAPTQFEAMPAAAGIGRERLRQAMERLLALGEIEGFDHENKGKGRSVKALRRASQAPRTSSRTLPEPLPNASPNGPGQFARTTPHTHLPLKGESGAADGAPLFQQPETSA